jgi:hypothetical protein
VITESFQKSKRRLLLSEILLALKDIMDLSGYVPRDGKSSLVFQELMQSWGGTEDELRAELMQNCNRPGSYKPEFPFATEYIALPCHFIALREKAYFMQIMHQKCPGDRMALDGKLAARCGVPKSRMLKYSLEDFLRMSRAERVTYATELTSLRSKQFKLYQLTLTRAEPTTFTRKRFVLSTGESTPFNYYKNQGLNALDRDGRKRNHRDEGD